MALRQHRQVSGGMDMDTLGSCTLTGLLIDLELTPQLLHNYGNTQASLGMQWLTSTSTPAFFA